MSADVHTLSGPYALDALTEGERSEFRQHLADCPACRDEVREMREAAARLGAAQFSVPPPGLRSRVLEAAARTPQLPPVVSPHDRFDSVADVEPLGPAGVARRRRHLPRLLAAAAAVLVLVGGGVALQQLDSDEPGGTDQPSLAVGPTRVFGAADAHTATVDTENGGSLTVGVSRERGEMAVDTRDLPPLDDGRVYQLWTVRDGGMTSAAVLTDTTDGASMPLPAGDTQVALTVEPDGGSEAPTGEPIVLVDPATV